MRQNRIQHLEARLAERRLRISIEPVLEQGVQSRVEAVEVAVVEYEFTRKVGAERLPSHTTVRERHT